MCHMFVSTVTSMNALCRVNWQIYIPRCSRWCMRCHQGCIYDFNSHCGGGFWHFEISHQTPTSTAAAAPCAANLSTTPPTPPPTPSCHSLMLLLPLPSPMTKDKDAAKNFSIKSSAMAPASPSKATVPGCGSCVGHGACILWKGVTPHVAP